MVKTYADVRELLTTKKFPELTGRGVSNEMIDEAEHLLGVRLPLSYRGFLLEYGWGYFGSLELIIGLGSDIPKEWEAGANIVKVTSDERNNSVSWPIYIIPICQNGAGDWYALDCSFINENESPVVFVGHERNATDGFNYDLYSKNFAEWIYLKLSD